jgi:8-oxo-dGTP pyrophosphatase MutT (NUDIX family)/ribosomal protein S18 acetylase RimI-like enzyme
MTSQGDSRAPASHPAGETAIVIRPATAHDAGAMWRIFHAVVATGDTYVFAADTSREDAIDYFLEPGIVSFVAEVDGNVAAMYKLIPNRRDRGSHVANASFMVDPEQSGRGLGWRIGRHCLEEAWARGYLSMQFNFVVSTNERAVQLWQRLGFSIVGRSPRGFRHRELGDVDALTMYRSLDDLAGDAAAFPLFGERLEGRSYIVRPCAYAIVPNARDEIVVVRTSEGVFLPGGGMDPGESPEQAAIRETREECALDIHVSHVIARATNIVPATDSTAGVEKRSTFVAGETVGSVAGPPEHKVLWVSPAEAKSRITRPAHAWAVEQWAERRS